MEDKLKQLEQRIERLEGKRILQQDIFPRAVKPYHLETVFGSMYATQAAISVTVSASDTWYEVTSGLSDGGLNDGITFQNNSQLKINYGGKYLMVRAIGMSTSGANDELMGTIAINDTVHEEFAGETNVSAANKISTSASTGIIDLKANDVVSIYVQNEDGARNITIEHLTLSLLRIGK